MPALNTAQYGINNSPFFQTYANSISKNGNASAVNSAAQAKENLAPNGADYAGESPVSRVPDCPDLKEPVIKNGVINILKYGGISAAGAAIGYAIPQKPLERDVLSSAGKNVVLAKERVPNLAAKWKFAAIGAIAGVFAMGVFDLIKNRGKKRTDVN